MGVRPARARHRFLVPGLDLSGRDARLPADESRHLTRVLRLKAGATVAVFDGRGHEFLGRVTDTADEAVSVALLEPVVPPRGPAVPFTLASAIVKGAAMDDIVRDATMMGAAAIQPLITQHTVVSAAVVARRGSVERWRRIAIASAKQSRRATIPDVREPVAVEQLLATGAGASVLIFVEPGTDRAAIPLRALIGRPRPSRALLMIGPEGGWTTAEIDSALAAGATPVTLGSLTLRAEAVPIAAVAMVAMVWDEDSAPEVC